MGFQWESTVLPAWLTPTPVLLSPRTPSPSLAASGILGPAMAMTGVAGGWQAQNPELVWLLGNGPGEVNSLLSFWAPQDTPCLPPLPQLPANQLQYRGQRRGSAAPGKEEPGLEKFSRELGLGGSSTG